MDLTGESLRYGRASEGTRVAVTVRGTASDLVLTISRRRPVDELDLAVDGDADLLGSWLDQVAFG